jgi:hypothetical protein
MTPHLASETEVADWLTTVGVTSLCQWDVLVFLAGHQATLLGVEALARLLGYATESLVAALDALEALTLVERSRVSQGARLYHCRRPAGRPARRGLGPAPGPGPPPHRPGPGGHTVAAGRSYPPTDTLRGRRQARDRTARRPLWLTAR